MSASCLEKPRLVDFPLVRAHLRGLIKGFQSRMIPLRSGLIVLSALHTLTVPVESAWPDSKPLRRPRSRARASSTFTAAQRLRLLLFFGTWAEVTALDIDLLDLGYHLQKLLLGLFCFGIAVSILDGCQGLFNYRQRGSGILQFKFRLPFRFPEWQDWGQGDFAVFFRSFYVPKKYMSLPKCLCVT